VQLSSHSYTPQLPDVVLSIVVGKSVKFATKQYVASNITHHIQNVLPHYLEKIKCSNLMHFLHIKLRCSKRQLPKLIVVIS